MDYQFGHAADHTVIEERLIREEIKKYNRENKILNKDDIPLYEITSLSLSFKSKKMADD